LYAAIKKIAEFIVFRNVFIAFAAACLVAETRFLCGSEWLSIDAVFAFTFFSTFSTYNFHSFSNDSEQEFSAKRIFKDFVNPTIAIEQRICVAVGIVATGISVLFLKTKDLWYLIPMGLVTMAYSLPLFRIRNRLRALRDIMYVKIITVALIWAGSTTILPYLDDGNHSVRYLLLLFAERFLFVYAITLPFEIRDRHGELAIGNRTIPVVYGVAKSKMLGYTILALYCIVVLVREFGYSHSPVDSMKHFIALFISAVSAALLLFQTNDSKSPWHYKFLIDGTMIEQFFLLIFVQFIC